ncbi:MAG: NUDIX domain-containing protein, partial [Cellvibrionaceae bacterium]|nr:NUDIX domain-containing protein [Cellvibrionaceae bacterium]
DRERHVCDGCETIHYSNPRIIVGCLPIHEDKVLLCRRAIEPRYDKWTLPAGFMENGESTEEGALREAWEEARAKLELDSLYTLYSLPQINQVHMFYRGHLSDLDFSPGPESLEVRLFSEDEIPWDELAFLVVGKTLKHYFADRQQGHYPVHSDTLVHPKGRDWKPPTQTRYTLSSANPANHGAKD